MSEQRNLVLAIGLSAVVLIGWQYVFVSPQMEAERARQEAAAEQAAGTEGGVGVPDAPAAVVTRDEALTRDARVAIDTPTVDGSINLTGGRLDDLRFKAYRVTPDAASDEIELLSPLATEYPYFVDLGWFAPQGAVTDLPDLETRWTSQGGTLSPQTPVTLTWRSTDGLVFTRTVAIDEQYMFTITDRVQNTGAAAVTLAPYAQILRPKIPDVPHNWVVHEGFIGVSQDVVRDPDYDDLADDNLSQTFTGTGGWAGITDKYWMTALIPDQAEETTGNFRAFDYNNDKAYEAKYEFEIRTVAPGATAEITHRVFAGPKVVELLETYGETQNIPMFDYAIDWGWFFFLTKPIFLALEFIFHYVGNFGVAILVFTVFVKLLFFPLANTSYRAMGKMKKLQPEVERLREVHKDDRVKLQQDMMALYQKEKVNPLAGCLPILVQIPVFFSLYKVLFVTIEMRHAPFFGWIRDLSAVEPITIVNLFGLLPFTPPGFLMIGVFPLVMGLTMWIQMKLNPPPADPVQQRVFSLMPWIFMVMMAPFPAGLVIYWTWNNILSIAQQSYIMKRSGVPIDLFDKMGKRFRKHQAEKEAGTRK
jgi:YidC/Oxa1 family membrane protein insertase